MCFVWLFFVMRCFCSHTESVRLTCVLQVVNQKEKKKVFLGGSFFFAFFHEKIFVDGGVFGDLTQPQSHNTSKITNHHLLVTSS